MAPAPCLDYFWQTHLIRLRDNIFMNGYFHDEVLNGRTVDEFIRAFAQQAG
jgi:hypothetical protein